MKIVPAILTQSSAELRQMLSQSATFTTFVQLDIMDGRFVPSKSVSADDLAQVTTGLDIEVHLMVCHPETYFARFKAAGAKRVLFHYEATASPQSVISLARQLGLKVGMALNPDTPASAVEPFLPGIDCVLFLSVNPGFYGSAFIPKAADRLWQFKKQHPEIEVGMDGGVKGWNLRRLRSFGVDYACVGSAIFKAADPGQAYHDLGGLLYRPPTPTFQPTSATEELLGQLLGYLRHYPDEPQREGHDRLMVSPEFEPALAGVLRAFGYSAQTRPPWVEVLAERQLQHAQELGAWLKEEKSDAFIYCL
ncbi:MAG: ribulose-phosphate 3-epimerase, partial [Chloroflexota bacterium]